MRTRIYNRREILRKLCRTFSHKITGYTITPLSFSLCLEFYDVYSKEYNYCHIVKQMGNINEMHVLLSWRGRAILVPVASQERILLLQNKLRMFGQISVSVIDIWGPIPFVIACCLSVRVSAKNITSRPCRDVRACRRVVCGSALSRVERKRHCRGNNDLSS